MSKALLASIIINNYNYGSFLKEAIDSALNQTFDNTEVIVVDDGSTDDSHSIITSYGDRIKPVLKKNGGQGSAFNAGFAVSSGDIVCFLDSDDTLLPTAIEMAAGLFQDPDTVKVHWPLRVVNIHGDDTGARFPSQETPEGDFSEISIKDGPFYDSKWLPPTSGNAWSRWFLVRVLPMPESKYDHGADVYLHSLAPIFGVMRRVAEPQGCYRAHGNNHYWRNVLSNKKIEEYIGRFDSSCQALREHLLAKGIAASPEKWKLRNFNYIWLNRLRLARSDINSLIPEGTCYILINQDEWGSGEAVEGRHSVPFLEKDTQYWGQPADDATAIAEVERLRQCGAEYLVFWWTCFWWLDHYKEFHNYLQTKFSCILENDRLLVFDLMCDTGR